MTDAKKPGLKLREEIALRISELGITHRAFADSCKMDQGLLSRYLRGKAEITTKKLDAILDALRIIKIQLIIRSTETASEIGANLISERKKRQSEMDYQRREKRWNKNFGFGIKVGDSDSDEQIKSKFIKRRLIRIWRQDAEID